MNDQPLKIAIVGTGVAGLSAAYILQRQHDVTLFEKNTYAGGHTNTIVIEKGNDAGTPLDTGFLVLNDRTYPTFHKLLSLLDVPVREVDMSFSYYNEKDGLQYAGTGLNGIFAQRTNLWNASFWGMILQLVRFNGRALNDLDSGKLSEMTLDEFLKENNFSNGFVHHYILPLGSSIWSTSMKDMLDFPATLFVDYLKNQGLLGFTNRPQWQRIVGGSQTYVKAILKTFKKRILMGSPVDEIRRGAEQVTIKTRDGQTASFDKVVLATHADEALGLLTDPTEEEQRLLSAWSYQKNHITLHTDIDVMPPNRRAWASWNYIRELETTRSEPVSMTYHLNRLQGLKTEKPYFVTLNRVRPIPEKYILKEIFYTHPTYTREAVRSQKELPSLNGVNKTYFCGSYFGYGFHEDAVKSAVAVAQCFGMDL